MISFKVKVSFRVRDSFSYRVRAYFRDRVNFKVRNVTYNFRLFRAFSKSLTLQTPVLKVTDF